MIGIFDSGTGGLFALHRLRCLLPRADLCYLGDTARLPYGSKPEDAICRYAQEAVSFFEDRRANSLLLACGTVSTVALPRLHAPFPLFGVVEPVCRRAAAAHAKSIGVIATAAAIRSGVYADCLHRLVPEAVITSVACPRFVSLAEAGARNAEHSVRKAVREALHPINMAKCDVLILGCTHFAHLAPAIRAALPGVTILDCGTEAANELSGQCSAMGQGRTWVFVTGDCRAFDRTAALRRIPCYPGAQTPTPVALSRS